MMTSPQSAVAHPRSSVMHRCCQSYCLSFVALGLVWLAPILAQATGIDTQHDLQFAVLHQPDHEQPHIPGLQRLASEVRRRTSIALAAEPAIITAESPELFNFPALFWQGSQAFSPLSPKAKQHLSQFLRRGGSLFVDCRDGQNNGPFEQSITKELAALLPEASLQRIPESHVFYKSFYLLTRHGGRIPVRPYLLGIELDGRLAVVVFANDLAGAISRSPFGEWTYPVAGGDAAREMTIRLGINWLMYVLCLDYKEDQVHLPFILERRK